MKQMYLFFLLFSMADAACQDFGVHGQTFEIAEEDLLSVIERKIKDMAQMGMLDQHRKTLLHKAKSQLRRPAPVNRICHAQTPRQWTYDPSITLKEDLKDHKGCVFAKKGQTFNPLKHMTLRAPLLFFDSDDLKQVAWAKAQHPQSTWILTSGAPFDLGKKHQRKVFFDQGGVITTQLKIQQVPCRVSQQDQQLLVEEVQLKQKYQAQTTQNSYEKN